MQRSITPIMLTFIGMIIVGALLIPFLLDLTDEPMREVGDTYTYSPATNFEDAEFTFGGTILDHSQYTVEDGTIRMTFTEEGTYTFTVTATTHNPYQTVTQTARIEVGEYSEYHDYKPLLLLIPTMLIVGFMLMVLGRRGGDSDGFGDMGYSGGGDIAGRFGRFGGR